MRFLCGVYGCVPSDQSSWFEAGVLLPAGVYEPNGGGGRVAGADGVPCADGRAASPGGTARRATMDLVVGG